MTPTLQKMVEAMAAEMTRQDSVAFKIHGHFLATLDLEKVAIAGLEAIRDQIGEKLLEQIHMRSPEYDWTVFINTILGEEA